MGAVEHWKFILMASYPTAWARCVFPTPGGKKKDIFGLRIELQVPDQKISLGGWPIEAPVEVFQCFQAAEISGSVRRSLAAVGRN